MPADAYQLGCGAKTADVATLLWTLLGDPDVDDSTTASRTLAELGVNSAGVVDLWAAVCEEFGEGSLGPEIDPGAIDSNMTVTAAAVTMVGLLTGADHDR